ncbi:MAG: serine protease [Bacteroidota bacterium]
MISPQLIPMILLCFLSILSYRGLKAGQTEPFGQKELQQGIVKISAKTETGIRRVGAGIVIGRDKKYVFILTPFHLIDDINGDPSATEVTIHYKGHWQAYSGTIYAEYLSSLDVAIIYCKAPSSFDFPIWDMAGDSIEVDQLVSMIGHPHPDWNIRKNHVIASSKSIDKPFFFTTTPYGIRGGFSGGAVWNEHKEIMGMILKVSSQEACILSMHPIKRIMEDWGIPTNYLLFPNERAYRLIELIRNAQKEHVGESCSDEANQHFDKEDLDRMLEEKVPQQLQQDLTDDPEFQEIIDAIENMLPFERQKLFEVAEKTYTLTWKQLGEVSCSGQSPEGQAAEREIVWVIVEKAKELLIPPLTIVISEPNTRLRPGTHFRVLGRFPYQDHSFYWLVLFDLENDAVWSMLPLFTDEFDVELIIPEEFYQGKIALLQVQPQLNTSFEESFNSIIITPQYTPEPGSYGVILESFINN